MQKMGFWLHSLSLANSYASSFSLLGSSLSSVVVNLVVLLAIVYLLSFLVLALLNYIGPFRRRLVALELVSPGFTELTRENYDELFSRVYGLSSPQSLKSKLLRRKSVLSFEVSASETLGTRFLVILSKDVENDFKKIARLSLSGLTITSARDLHSFAYSSLSSRFTEFKLKRPFYNSLKDTHEMSLAYQASFMDFQKHDNVIFQMTLTPMSSLFNTRMLKKMEDIDQVKRGLLSRFIYFWFNLALLFLEPNRLKPAKSLQVDKLTRPLFRTSLRLFIECENKEDVDARLRAFKSSMSVLASPGRQMIISRFSPSQRLLKLKFKKRLPDILSVNTPILSITELASLYHFPGVTLPGSELMKKSLSRTLPVSLTHKSKKDDVLIGENTHAGKSLKIGLTKDERSRHLYILGGTGNGKTTMLEYMISQDIDSGKDLMLVDPHGDLAEAVLGRVRGSRREDVIYFNPSDLEHPIPINLLSLPVGLSRTELAREKDLVTESIISVFRKTFEQTDDGSSYRIERLLRYAIQTALHIENATLFTVSRILSDKYYRWRVIEKLKDESLKRFWAEEFNKAGDYQRIKMSLGPLSRLERFERNGTVSQIIDSPGPGLDFEEVLRSKKILICNLSKGALGEDVSSLLGSVLLAKLQLAAYRRQKLDKVKRTPFYLYVDEFQNYASPAFINMFSESRKFGLFLTIAQQSPAQLSDSKMLDIIMDNVGSLVAFRSKSLASEKLILPLFAPYIGKHEISNLPRYSFYAKISAAEPLPPVSGRTVLLKPASSAVTNLVIESSRQLYARPLTLWVHSTYRHK